MGNSLDNILAYVDENGNLISSPPDPMRRCALQQEEIQIRVPKQESLDLAQETIRQGVISFFNESKRFGFIIDQKNQNNVFEHAYGLIDPIRENDKVTFEIEITPKGASAIKVKKVP